MEKLARSNWIGCEMMKNRSLELLFSVVFIIVGLAQLVSGADVTIERILEGTYTYSVAPDYTSGSGQCGDYGLQGPLDLGSSSLSDGSTELGGNSVGWLKDTTSSSGKVEVIFNFDQAFWVSDVFIKSKLQSDSAFPSAKLTFYDEKKIQLASFQKDGIAGDGQSHEMEIKFFDNKQAYLVSKIKLEITASDSYHLLLGEVEFRGFPADVPGTQKLTDLDYTYNKPPRLNKWGGDWGDNGQSSSNLKTGALGDKKVFIKEATAGWLKNNDWDGNPIEITFDLQEQSVLKAIRLSFLIIEWGGVKNVELYGRADTNEPFQLIKSKQLDFIVPGGTLVDLFFVEWTDLAENVSEVRIRLSSDSYATSISEVEIFVQRSHQVLFESLQPAPGSQIQTLRSPKLSVVIVDEEAEQGCGVDREGISLTLNNNPLDFTYNPTSGQVSFYDPELILTTGLYTVKIAATCRAGEHSRDSWSFIIINPENLLINGDFEDWPPEAAVPAGWNSTGEIHRDTENTLSGENSLRINGLYVSATQEVPVEPGLAYTLSFWAKSDNPSYGAFQSEARDSGGNSLKLLNWGVFSITEDWSEYSYQVIPPPGTVKLYVKLMKTDTTDTEDAISIYFDKASITMRDVSGPAFSDLTPEPEALVDIGVPQISATLQDSSGIRPESVILELDGKAVEALFGIGENKVSYQPETELEDGIHTVKISARDWVGNVGNQNTIQWSFMIQKEVVLTVDKKCLPADGNDLCTIQVQVTNFSPGDTVSISTSIGEFENGLMQIEKQLNESGSVEVKLRSNQKGIALIQANFKGKEGRAYIEFIGNSIQLQVKDQALLADGRSQTTVTLVVRGMYEEEVPAATVNLTASLGSLESSTVVTNAQGIAEVNYIAGLEDGFALITASWEDATAEITVHLLPGTIKIQAPKMLCAGGSDRGTIYLYVNDVNGNPVGGETVIVKIDHGFFINEEQEIELTLSEGIAETVLLAPEKTGQGRLTVTWRTLSEEVLVSFIQPSAHEIQFLTLEPNPLYIKEEARTQISFALSVPSKVDLIVFNTAGKYICTLYRGELLPANTTVVKYWDGKDQDGKTVPSGLYILYVATEKQKSIRNLLVFK
jgi:hypothetical protein